ncbi:MAG TPA: NADH-quinone oxidoreductase subunit N [bacterium]|mgnify:CR=1 FL=1|nr:NADH-quinone oxidoreductase subunit N [bacterium]HQG44712.1 NADH-quinone oxidoreductase subunit N [bacterium]HQI49611.1 NADH-quinone oxidoreductase subunit N [bacterium]HQJ63946.1 NADH-quinone oxidoreductase subunit N [bacterium]
MALTAPQIQLDLIAPQLLLLAAALLLLLLPLFWRGVRRELLAAIAVLGLAAAFAAAAGLWTRPGTGFNGMVTLDRFALAFDGIFLLGGLLAVLISLNRVEDEYVQYGDFYGLLLLAVAGMTILTATLHLIIIFLGLELLSIALYVMIGFRKMRVDSTEASLKYFLLGSFATGFLLYGMALIYGAAGTLDLQRIGAAVAAGSGGWMLLAGGMLLLIGFAFKAALVPFHMWTPDVYQGAPTPVTAFMSTATKAAAFAALARIVTTAMPFSAFNWSAILPVLAVLTMTVGNLLAITQENTKRMLAYSSIAHAGYLLVALSAGNAAGQSAILYYLVVYTLMNAGAFAVIAWFGRSNREERLTFASYRGLGYRYPFASLAMAVFMFSLAGIPPTGGFLGKFYLFAAAVKAGQTPLVVIAVMNAVVSVYYYTRLVVHLYMREAEEPLEAEKLNPGLMAALLLALLGVLWLGVAPNGLMALFNAAALAAM